MTLQRLFWQVKQYQSFRLCTKMALTIFLFIYNRRITAYEQHPASGYIYVSIFVSVHTSAYASAQQSKRCYASY